MKRREFLLALFVFLSLPLYSAAPQHQQSRESWYERVMREINPNDTDYGAIWEQRKRVFMGRIGSPCFQYGLAATVTIVWLFIIVFAQQASHRRAEEVAVESIADVLRHDAYAREKAREAIKKNGQSSNQERAASPAVGSTPRKKSYPNEVRLDWEKHLQKDSVRSHGGEFGILPPAQLSSSVTGKVYTFTMIN